MLRGWRETQYLVLIRGINAAAVTETFEHLAARRDPRVTALYPFAGELAGAVVMEAGSAAELPDMTTTGPAGRLCTFEYHTIAPLPSPPSEERRSDRRWTLPWAKRGA